MLSVFHFVEEEIEVENRKLAQNHIARPIGTQLV